MSSSSTVDALSDELKVVLDDNGLWQSQYQSLINEEVSLGMLILHMLNHDREKTFQVCFDYKTQCSYNEMRLHSVRVAQNLMKHGIEQGEMFGFIGSNTKYLAAFIFGVIYCGGIINPLDPLSDKNEIMHMFNITHPKYIFCDKIVYNLVQESIKDIKLECELFVMNGEITDVMSAEFFLRPTKNEDRFIPTKLIHGSDQTFAVMCTTGITGPSKGVCVSHRSIIHSIMSFQHSSKNIPKSCIFTTFSTIHWICGLWSLLYCVIRGAKSIITYKQFTPKLLLEIVEEYEVTFLLTTPNQISSTLESDAIKKYDMTTIRTWLVGGSRLSTNIAKKMETYLSRGFIMNSYGLTEMGPILTRETYYDNRIGSVGKIVPYAILQVVDDNAKVVKPNQIGEIWANNRCKWSGYYNNVNETLAVYSEDGWFHTGDMGYYDEDGYLYLTGHKNEIIKYKSFSFYPNDVENVIEQITGVVEACVCGISNPIDNEIPAAAIIKTSDSKLTEDDIHRYIERNTVHFKHLRGGVFFMDKFPKSSTGRIIRKKIKIIVEYLYREREKEKENEKLSK